MNLVITIKHLWVCWMHSSSSFGFEVSVLIAILLPLRDLALLHSLARGVSLDLANSDSGIAFRIGCSNIIYFVP